MENKTDKNIWLLPLYFVAGIFPFVVFGKHLISPFEGEIWGYETLSGLDLYGYYKGISFAILLCFFLFTGFFELMEQRKRETIPWGKYLNRIKIYKPLVLFVAGVLLSSVISGRWDVSMVMADSTYETVWLVLLYVCFLLYISSVTRRTEEVGRIFCVLGTGAFIFSLFGFLELLGFAPLTWEAVQKLLVRPKDFHLTEVLYFLFPGRITVTLFNPDYAGQYLIIVFPVVCSLAFLAEKKTRKWLWSTISISIVVAAFLTGYRGVILALGAMVLVFAAVMLMRKRAEKKNVSKSVVCGLLVVVLFSIVLFSDVLLNKGLFSGVTDFENEAYFEELYIEHDGVVAATKSSKIKIYPSDHLKIVDVESGKDITERYDAVEGELKHPGFEEIVVIYRNEEAGERRELCLITYGVYWNFEIVNGEICYLNRAMKRDSLDEVSGVFPEEWDTLGAGRVYTWSRTLPILKHCLLYGYGENSFATVFPQTDYLQKTKVFGTNAMIVDHAHNLFLTIWLYYGLPALVGVLWLFVLYVKKVLQQLMHIGDNRRFWLQMGCFLSVTAYAVTACFNDSTVFVTPVFLLIFGLSVAQILLGDRNEQ